MNEITDFIAVMQWAREGVKRLGMEWQTENKK